MIQQFAEIVLGVWMGHGLDPDAYTLSEMALCRRAMISEFLLHANSFLPFHACRLLNHLMVLIPAYNQTLSSNKHQVHGSR